MKPFLLKIIILLSCIATQAQDSSQMLAIDISGGYQTTDLQWSIAGNSNAGVVNVLSEVKWRALGGPVLNGGFKFTPTRHWFVAGDIAKCFIKSGNATDTDYGDNDRQLPTYNAQLDSDEGSLLSYRFLGGYNFLQRKRLVLAVFAGYCADKASLFLLDHAAAIEGAKNLRCTYNTSWKGIAGGTSAVYRLTSWLDLSGELQYSQLNYEAVADWNLIAAFKHPVSFQQQARGFDVRMSLSTVCRINRYLALFSSFVYRQAETGTGTDELFLDSGDVQQTQFNGAVTHAAKISIGARFQF